MKNYLKRLVFRILILIIIIIVLSYLLEFLISLSNSRKEYIQWKKENELINLMNMDKLKNADWDSNPLWIHKEEDLQPKKENIKRILIIGDSFIWGDGYSNANHIWWQQFRRKLKENGYNDVEVVAAGLCGYSTKQEFENILQNNELMAKIDPDLIIFGYVSNDPEFRDNEGKLFVKPIDSDDLFYDSDNIYINKYKHLLPYTYNSLSLLIANKFINTDFRNHFGLGYSDYLTTISSGEWLNKYELEVIKPLKNYMENNFNIPYFFFMTSKEKEPGIDNIISVLEKNEIDYYFAFNDYTQKEQNVKINPANWHPSVALCNSFAETLLNIMEINYTNILGHESSYNPTININDWMPYSLNVEKVSNNTYNFIYPNSKNINSFLSLPIMQKYIKLNLEEPFPIKNILITGDNIKEIEIFINKIDKDLGYDNQKFISLGVKKENFNWVLVDNELITSINVSVKTNNGEPAKLTINIE